MGGLLMDLLSHLKMDGIEFISRYSQIEEYKGIPTIMCTTETNNKPNTKKAVRKKYFLVEL